MTNAMPIISADSHITEPPNCYTDYVDAGWRDRAPRIDRRPDGDVFVIDGMKQAVNLGLVAAAGKPAEEITLKGGRFEELHRGGWDPDARMQDQARDGVAAEVIYPTVGMLLCNHKDFDYKRACFTGYNRWLAEYCGAHPKRLIGMGQVAMASPEDGIAELRAIKQLGLRGVMMPGNPAVEDYDSPAYDDFWRAALDLELPLAFHILTSKEDVLLKPRGPKMNGFLTIIRGCQDVIGTMLLGGVFERHPRLKIVCVEADAGWVPHYMYRMDHAFKRHRNWLPPGQALAKLPSEYFRENVYTTFQDDWVAFKTADLMNWHRLMWANDFPHSDSTWPWSQ
jgi:predicted TIM-barrel fold metal-dependent hydrolase